MLSYGFGTRRMGFATQDKEFKPRIRGGSVTIKITKCVKHKEIRDTET